MICSENNDASIVESLASHNQGNKKIKKYQQAIIRNEQSYKKQVNIKEKENQNVVTSIGDHVIHQIKKLKEQKNSKSVNNFKKYIGKNAPSNGLGSMNKVQNIGTATITNQSIQSSSQSPLQPTLHFSSPSAPSPYCSAQSSPIVNPGVVHNFNSVDNSVSHSHSHSHSNLSPASLLEREPQLEKQLTNHRIRKQIQSYHNKAISQFLKKKKADAGNKKDKKIRNRVKLEDYNKQQQKQSKASNQQQKNNETIIELNKKYKKQVKQNQFTKFLRCQAGQTNDEQGNMHRWNNQIFRRTQTYARNSKWMNDRDKIIDSLITSYIGSAIDLKSYNSANQYACSVYPYPSITASLSRRQIHLSNITNLAELRHSLSHSRAKFHRKAIKMERQIGRQYVPYQERVVGDGAMGIFM